MRLAAHLAFVLALALGLGLVLRGGWPILLLGLTSLGAGYAYTGGPRPIAYGPFGEVYVLLFFGVAAVAGTYWLQTLSLSPGALWLGMALGLPASAVLLLNNDRDLETDRAAGRRTLCQVIGRRRARRLYAVLLIAAPVMLAVAGPMRLLPGWGWPALLAVPLALALIRPLAAGLEGPALNRLLGRTAQYQALLVLLLGLGLMLPELLPHRV